MNNKERATMARRYEIDDAQWEKIKPYLGNTPKKTGRPQADNRKLLNGVLWIMHTGAPSRDLPEYYGPWQTVYKRFSQWQKDEKLRQLFENVRENPDMQDLCIDGTYIKAHRSSAGAKKGLRDMMIISISESAGEEDPPKSTREWMDSVIPWYWNSPADRYMMGSCFKIVLNSSIFPAVLFLLTKPMAHGKTVNTLPTMTLTSAFRRSRTPLILGTPISITTKKGLLLNAFS